MWEKIKESEESTGFRRNFSRHYRLPSGKIKGYDITEIGETVSILAITPDNKVILVEQFRPGPEETTLELPGGLVDAGESPSKAAARELLEETGYVPGEGGFYYVTSKYIGAYIAGVRHIFAAVRCQKTQEASPDPDEFIAVRLMPLPELRAWLRTCNMVDTGETYQALDFLGEL